jgi:hypothetical protein
MFGLFCFVLTVLASLFKSKRRLVAENAVFRHQLIVVYTGNLIRQFWLVKFSVTAFEFPVPSQKFPVPLPRGLYHSGASSVF